MRSLILASILALGLLSGAAHSEGAEPSTSAPPQPDASKVSASGNKLLPPAGGGGSYVPFPRPREETRPVFPSGRTALPAATTQRRVGPSANTTPSQVQANPAGPTGLKWKSELEEYTAKQGDTTAHLTFTFTNVSSEEIVINWVRTSCGCTVAKMPPTPWTNAPGAFGEINVTMDLRGKVGTLSKIVTVDTSKGPKYLTVKANIPAIAATGGMDARTRNMELAKVDRQIVFRNDCADCHAKPAEGKHGEALYAAACAVCHDSPHRATMVPDLRALKITPTKEYWKAWVSNGKPGTLMPAFAKSQHGILDDAQIDSLVEYLTKNFPPKETAPKPTPTSAAAGTSPTTIAR